MDLLKKGVKIPAPDVASSGNPKLLEKIDILQKAIGTECTTSKINKYMITSLVVVPLVIFVILYLMSPSFVMTQEIVKETANPDKSIRSSGKVFMWTIGLTLLVWGAIYGYCRYKGYSIKLFC